MACAVLTLKSRLLDGWIRLDKGEIGPGVHLNLGSRQERLLKGYKAQAADFGIHVFTPAQIGDRETLEIEPGCCVNRRGQPMGIDEHLPRKVR